MKTSINFQIGTYIHPRPPDHVGERSRSHRHIIYPAKICLNSVPDGPINFILGCWHQDHPVTSGAQNGGYGNTGCLATGPWNLHFMIEYLKNAKVYKLNDRQVSSTLGPGHMSQFWFKKVKYLGHTGI